MIIHGGFNLFWLFTSAVLVTCPVSVQSLDVSFKAMPAILGCYMFPEHMIFLLSFENLVHFKGSLEFLCQKCHQDLFFQFTIYIKLTPIVTCNAVFCKNPRRNQLSKGAAMEIGYSQDRFLLNLSHSSYPPFINT